ncbi:LysR family transcriptional regulator [Ruminococcus sp. JL13D9]|uniref:LysR family transcriptional regulator n=1 Tax=Ruminococcus sp. JL13D9 TaxID=3233381 RepID=UPI003899F67D
MDINQLNCFISVAQTLNFSEAARRNYVSQSSVSRYIGDLEQEFGVQLFTRSHRDVIITNEGKILLPYALEIVNTLSKAKTVVKQIRDGSTGRLTVGCDITSMSFPSKCLEDFSAKYPGIEVELKPFDAADRSQAITGGEFDFCFMPRDMVPENSGIETLITHTEPLVFVASKQNMKGKNSKMSFSKLSSRRLLILSESVAPILFMEIMDLLRTFHISPEAQTSFDDLSSLYLALSAGMGVTILPKSLAGFASEERTVCCPIEDVDTAMSYVMAWSKSNSNPVAERFIDTVQKYALGDDNIYGL